MTENFPFYIYIYVCIYTPYLLIHSSVDGHIGCFHLLVIVNSAVMNIGEHVSFWVIVFSRHAAAATAAKSLQSCPTLYNPIDGSPLGSSIPGILQARILEWVAISFSNAWKWKVKVKSLSRARLLVTPWTAVYQAPPSMGFSRQENWSGLPLPSLNICPGNSWVPWMARTARRSNQSILKEINPDIHWKNWCWSCNSSILVNWFEKLTHWKSPSCWERLRVEEEDIRGWDGWMASLMQWTWAWANSRRWWGTGRPGMLQSMGFGWTTTTMVTLFLYFKGSFTVFSIMAAPTYMPTNSVGGSPFLYTLFSMYGL